MATFHYNPRLRESIVTQWHSYLQQNAYIRDVQQIISKNSSEIQETIRTGTAEQVEAINNVCGQIEITNSHLLSIDDNITGLRGEICSMASMLDWKTSKIIEELRIANQLLGSIVQLLRIPDSQKQRVYHIEKGLKYLMNAFIEDDVNSSFYIDALEELKKAENIERKDFITLNRIGQVHLYSKKYTDFAEAASYFLKSARESFAEANVKGTTASNNLLPNGYEVTVDKTNLYLAATAESYLYAGRAFYLQRNLDKATEYAGKAFELVPEFLQAGFEQAKYLTANGEEDKAVGVLKQVIAGDRNFSIKTLLDEDLISKKGVTQLLERLKSESYNEAKNRLDKLNVIARKDSHARINLSKMNRCLSENNFLSSMQALDMLNKKYKHFYVAYDVYDYTITKKQVNPPLALEEFLVKENSSEAELRRLIQELEGKKSKVINDHSISHLKNGALIGAGIVGIFMLIGLLGSMSSPIPEGYLSLLLGVILYVLGGGILGAITGAIIGLFKRPKIKIIVK